MRPWTGSDDGCEEEVDDEVACSVDDSVEEDITLLTDGIGLRGIK